MVLVAPASRRLFALSSNSYPAGKMPALLQLAVAQVAQNSQPIRRQLESVAASKCATLAEAAVWTPFPPP